MKITGQTGPRGLRGRGDPAARRKQSLDDLAFGGARHPGILEPVGSDRNRHRCFVGPSPRFRIGYCDRQRNGDRYIPYDADLPVHNPWLGAEPGRFSRFVGSTRTVPPKRCRAPGRRGLGPERGVDRAPNARARAKVRHHAGTDIIEARPRRTPTSRPSTMTGFPEHSEILHMQNELVIRKAFSSVTLINRIREMPNSQCGEDRAARHGRCFSWEHNGEGPQVEWRWTNEIPAGFFSHQCCAALTSLIRCECPWWPRQNSTSSYSF
jgi:hypothetical protein